MPQEMTQREYWSGKVGDEWALHAERIDAMLAPITAAALDFAAFEFGERVRDIGCGAGATSLAIARRVGPTGRVVGVDLSSQMLDVARARARHAALTIDFLDADASSADFGRRFDGAFSRFGVMFFAAPVEAFAHIRASMREKGRLRFVCWRPMSENIWATAPLEAIAPMLRTPLATPDPDAPGPYSLADDAKLRRVLQGAGWSEIALSRWDGAVSVGGGGTLEESASFLLRIGPCARAIAEQELDAAEAKQRLMDRLAPHHGKNGVSLPAACWLVAANA
ncbi:MAG: methyltransferase domain-containing protein [Proteobacteria bacterium]|nr:methyltransferase domain-containing protein [Pseudomonadota bacterium]